MVCVLAVASSRKDARVAVGVYLLCAKSSTSTAAQHVSTWCGSAVLCGKLCASRNDGGEAWCETRPSSDRATVRGGSGVTIACFVSILVLLQPTHQSFAPHLRYAAAPSFAMIEHFTWCRLIPPLAHRTQASSRRKALAVGDDLQGGRCKGASPTVAHSFDSGVSDRLSWAGEWTCGVLANPSAQHRHAPDTQHCQILLSFRASVRARRALLLLACDRAEAVGVHLAVLTGARISRKRHFRAWRCGAVMRHCCHSSCDALNTA